MRRALRVSDLICHYHREITVFQDLIERFEGKPGTRGYIGDLKMRIAMAERSNAILRSESWRSRLLQRPGKCVFDHAVIENLCVIRAAGGVVLGARNVDPVELRQATHADVPGMRTTARPIALVRFGVVPKRAFGEITYDRALAGVHHKPALCMQHDSDGIVVVIDCHGGRGVRLVADLKLKKPKS
jgi:hypothetical protein